MFLLSSLLKNTIFKAKVVCLKRYFLENSQQKMVKIIKILFEADDLSNANVSVWLILKTKIQIGIQKLKQSKRKNMFDR